MGDLVTLFSGSGFGAAIGLIGGLGQKFLDLRAKRIDHEFQIKCRNQDIAEANHERAHDLSMADKRMDLAEVEGAIQISAKQTDAFVESQKTAGRAPMLTYVRAAITFYLLVAVSVLFFQVWNKVGGINSFSIADLSLLLDHMIRSALFLVTTCVCWWFAAQSGNMKGLFKR